MIVLIDGKEVEVLNNVKIIYSGVKSSWMIDDEEIEAEFHVTLTNEGIITDVVHDDEIIGTMSQTTRELAEDCI